MFWPLICPKFTDRCFFATREQGSGPIPKKIHWCHSAKKKSPATIIKLANCMAPGNEGKRP